MTASKPLRVLVNAVHSKSGGGLTYLRNALPLLAARMEIHLCVQEDQRKEAEGIVAAAPAIRLHVLPKLSKLATVLVQEQVAVPMLARRIKADVVFSPANYGPILGPPTVILLRNAFAVEELEKRLDKRLYWAAVKGLTWACFKTCRRAMAVSGHAARAFLAVFGLAEDSRLSVVHHGVGAGFHPPAPGKARLPERLLAVSDVYVQKNFETLIRALALLAPDRPDLRLDVAGRELDPAYSQSLRALCAELGVADRVSFLGGQTPGRVAELYRQASVFVFPSLVETFGNPLVEAMASGIPVVCSESAALPEITGGAALLARPRAPEHMAALIKSLLDDPALWAETAAKGLARAADFSWERTAAQVAEVLAQAASGH